ncbi:MAG: PDDEXK nuclease domain-containing protein [Lachnospiraceae bacterium]|nr:PDDEXK nuclease domain-containing protein [Lachnospiraceae bacterium]
MNQLIRMDEEYRKWIEELGKRYKQRQIKAAVSVNQEMIGFYWSIGRDIVEKSAESKWGSGFFDNLSKDMKIILPEVQGLSSSNLRYMKKFYELYSDSNFPQLVGDLSDKELFSIPWGHHRVIIDKCKLNREKSIFFVKKTILNNWSRAVLLNFLDTDLYERQGKAISNFEYALPEPQSDLAQEITRDPYNFDFVAIGEDYSEKELKDALLDNITKFLMELGKGFAFVGREYIIPIEGTEEKIDLLFYHLYLHCYVVVEVKIVPFTSGDIGQVGTYVNVVDNLVKTDFDAKTIGLIICKSKNNILAKYAVNSSKEPIGISAYELANLLPVEYRTSLPTIEEIENELR